MPAPEIITHGDLPHRYNRVRDESELAAIAEYIAANAVRAKLALAAADWRFCSAHDRVKPREKRLAVVVVADAGSVRHAVTLSG
jgi:hypothetical protein